MAFETIAHSDLIDGDDELRQMVRQLATKLSAGECQIEDGVPDIYFKWDIRDNTLGKSGTKMITVVLGRHHVTNFYLTKEDMFPMAPNDLWVMSELRKYLRAKAHTFDPCLNGLADVVRATYFNIGCDTRPDGAYVPVQNGFALCIYRYPEYLVGEDVTGNVVSDVNLFNALARFVPKKTLSQVDHMIRSFAENWHYMHGGQKATIRVYTKSRMSGEHLYVTVGNVRSSVRFKFARINLIDQHTLHTEPQLSSLLRDFKE